MKPQLYGALLLLLGGCGNPPGGNTPDMGPVSDIAQLPDIVPLPDMLQPPDMVLESEAVRTLIGTQVGGLAKLTVPPDDTSIPVPPDDTTRPGRYKTTPAKKYLGKLLFHDPVRTARVNINAGVPLDLPVGTAFGGTVNGADP